MTKKKISELPVKVAQSDDTIIVVQDGVTARSTVGDLPTLKGDKGDNGTAGITDVTASALTAGSSPTATLTGTLLTLGIPAGQTGTTGPANTLTVGTVTTGAAGSSAAATVTGTAPNQTLNLTIPQGAVGPSVGATTLLTAARTYSAAAVTTALTRLSITEVSDSGNHYDGTLYTVTAAGAYLCVLTVALSDSTTANVSYGVAVDTSDSYTNLFFSRTVTGVSTNRNDVQSSRIIACAAGDQLRALLFTDNTSVTLAAASLQIVRVA